MNDPYILGTIYHGMEALSNMSDANLLTITITMLGLCGILSGVVLYRWGYNRGYDKGYDDCWIGK